MVRWTVDDRRLTLWTRLYLVGMRLRRDKRAFEGGAHTLDAALRRQDTGDAPPDRWTRLVRQVSREVVEGMVVWRARPRSGRAAVRVVYLHGGGYVHPLSGDYWRLVRALTRDPVEVVVPAYPLAPRAGVDDVLPALQRVARSPDDGLPRVLMGDSAGGALAITLATSLDDTRMVVALCPWLDATLGDPAVAGLEATDPMLAESGLREAGRWWARPHSPLDPRVSPVLAGLPRSPVHLFIGDRDILRPAVDDLAARAEREDSLLHVHEVTAMFHVWMTRAIPEGRRTRRELRRLLAEVG